MTLVEIMVVLAVGILVMGLLLGMLISTNTAAKKENRYSELWQEAVLSAQQIEDLLERGVETPLDAAETAIFTQHQLAMYVISGNGGYDITRVVVNNATVDNRARISLGEYSPGADSEAMPHKTAGLNIPQVSTSVSFKYALETENFTPVWKFDLGSGERPLLVNYTVKVQDQELLVKPVILTSTVRIAK